MMLGVMLFLFDFCGDIKFLIFKVSGGGVVVVGIVEFLMLVFGLGLFVLIVVEFGFNVV